jgi:hypothetical protein
MYSVSSIVRVVNRLDGMAERKLRIRSVSLGRDVDEGGSETSHIEAESNNPSQVAEICSHSFVVNSVNDRQVDGHSDHSNIVVISANQFQEFMSIVMKDFDYLKASMRVENNKLAESIKAVSEEMTVKIEVANKTLSDSLTKQFREEHASLKKGNF